jgi:hypothetical protein
MARERIRSAGDRRYRVGLRVNPEPYTVTQTAHHNQQGTKVMNSYNITDTREILELFDEQEARPTPLREVDGLRVHYYDSIEDAGFAVGVYS